MTVEKMPVPFSPQSKAGISFENQGPEGRWRLAGGDNHRLHDKSIRPGGAAEPCGGRIPSPFQGGFCSITHRWLSPPANFLPILRIGAESSQNRLILTPFGTGITPFGTGTEPRRADHRWISRSPRARPLFLTFQTCSKPPADAG